MPTQLARFTSPLPAPVSKSLRERGRSAAVEGGGGYANWVIVALHGPREYLDHRYRRLLDVLEEMRGIVNQPGSTVEELPDFTAVCARKQEQVMAVWRVLRESAALRDTGECRRHRSIPAV